MTNPFMQEALALAVENVQAGLGGPFAAIVVRNGQVIARATNRVTAQHDPTAHAEVLAIREACRALQAFQLNGCDLYTTCEPCPMCLGAIYWARLDRIYYAATQKHAAAAGFDDAFIYEELERDPKDRRIAMIPCMPEAARHPFEAWERFGDRIEY